MTTHSIYSITSILAADGRMGWTPIQFQIQGSGMSSTYPVKRCWHDPVKAKEQALELSCRANRLYVERKNSIIGPFVSIYKNTENKYEPVIVSLEDTPPDRTCELRSIPGAVYDNFMETSKTALNYSNKYKMPIDWFFFHPLQEVASGSSEKDL